jgi:hypothetical protein
MNLMMERKEIKNSFDLFSMILPDNENEETIEPKKKIYCIITNNNFIILWCKNFCTTRINRRK